MNENHYFHSPFNTPLNSISGLQRQINRLFDAVPGTTDAERRSADWQPSVDIEETGDSFMVHMDVPGVAPTDIDVTVERNLLTIRGNRTTVTTSDAESGSYRRRERHSGAFMRQFTLPDNADVDSIVARSNQGVLSLTIPKGSRGKPISISVGEGEQTG